MIRAFALFSLTMLAACAHSHAAAPAPPPVDWVAGQPEDPYGDARGRETQLCPSGETCAFECPQGGCAFSCAEGSTCNVECDGGHCKLACGINAQCAEARKINVSAAFFLSIEFQETGYLVYRTYKAAYGNFSPQIPVPLGTITGTRRSCTGDNSRLARNRKGDQGFPLNCSGKLIRLQGGRCHVFGLTPQGRVGRSVPAARV